MDRLTDDSYVARGLGLITATVGRPAEFYLYSKYDDGYENIDVELRGRDGDAGAATIAPGPRRRDRAAGPGPGPGPVPVPGPGPQSPAEPLEDVDCLAAGTAATACESLRCLWHVRCCC